MGKNSIAHDKLVYQYLYKIVQYLHPAEYKHPVSMFFRNQKQLHT